MAGESLILFCVSDQELKAGFDLEAAQTGASRLLLTAAVGAGKSTVDSAYEVQQISE